MKNLVDSSGWLEFFTDGSMADEYAPALEDVSRLIVPTVCMNEVCKVILRERGEDAAIQAMALMRQGIVAELSPETAMLAAKISLEKVLPMTDSIILATAFLNNAQVWTHDEDFRGISGVKYLGKVSRIKSATVQQEQENAAGTSRA